MPSNRRRYALVGTGFRSQVYIDAIVGPHADAAELVAWSDPNPGRLDWHEQRLRQRGAALPMRFDPDTLAATVERLDVDRVVVTSPDATHSGHIVSALDGGAEAVVEKPLATTDHQVRDIADAVHRTGRQVVVTFNYRYSPRNAALKELIASGAIGDVTSVHFEWLLDTAHGADYFRRWHRDKDASGGLLVHKASHHFDLVNWWLDDAPSRVFASGGLRFYGAENARRRSLGPRPERGSIDSARHDAFSLDLRDDPALRGLYYDSERHDGYLRDRDVFDPGISIEDNLSLVVEYVRGASMSYSLNAHAPWEGYVVAVNGTAGRAELTVVERGAVLVDDSERRVVDPSSRPGDIDDDSGRPVGERLVVQRHFDRATTVPVPAGDGGHGGGDAELLRDLLRGADGDRLGQAATWHDGVRALAVGLAGNRSLETGQAVRLDDLGLGAAGAALSDGRR